MIDAEEFALAQSYQQLETHPAWQNLRGWLVERVAGLEQSAVEASVSEPNRAARGKLIAWQQAKMTLDAIDGKIEDALAYLAESAKEQANERAVERDRAGRDGW